MGITYSQMVANTASVAVPIGQYSLNLEYYPELITDDVFVLLATFQDIKPTTMLDALTTLNKSLVSLIKSWDYLEDDGQTMMPIEEETFRKFSVNFKTDMLAKMIANIRPEVAAAQIPNS